MMTVGTLRSALRLARRYDDLMTLALDAESQALALNGIEHDDKRGASDSDVLAVLGSACVLLERVPRKSRSAEPPEPPSSPSMDPESQPPPAVRELIALRDMVLMASESNGSAEALEVIGRKLRQVLEKEGVRPLEDDGAFDYRFQEVLDVQETDDPAKDESVCATIRPGYAFGDRVLRPQQIVMYRLED